MECAIQSCPELLKKGQYAVVLEYLNSSDLAWTCYIALWLSDEVVGSSGGLGLNGASVKYDHKRVAFPYVF